jgi:hypothetical protein
MAEASGSQNRYVAAHHAIMTAGSYHVHTKVVQAPSACRLLVCTWPAASRACLVARWCALQGGVHYKVVCTTGRYDASGPGSPGDAAAWRSWSHQQAIGRMQTACLAPAHLLVLLTCCSHHAQARHRAVVLDCSSRSSSCVNVEF